MSSKRSRAAYESDFLTSRGAPFVFLGTSVLETSNKESGGNYVPLHNQEVRDDRGRRRLHGAFTGGWSAGYFNTVGSKEGWTPSQFTSSRGDRREAEAGRAQNLPQHFMDEEDLADAADSQRLDTSESFTGIGGHHHDSLFTDRFMNLLHVKSETAGVMILNRLGWRVGQGIGPKISRRPRLGGAEIPTEGEAISIGSSYLFAPDDIAMVPFTKKTDRSGLGLHGPEDMTHQYPGKTGTDDGKKASEPHALSGVYSTSRVPRGPSSRRGFGVGVLNDSSSGEDDPYEIGPKITHIRRVRGQRKAKSSTRGQSSVQASSSGNMGRPRPGGAYHDEKIAIQGFVGGAVADIETGAVSQLQGFFSIPAGWTPSRRRAANSADESARIHPHATSPPMSKSAARGRVLGEPETFRHSHLASRPGSISAFAGLSGPMPLSTQGSISQSSGSAPSDQIPRPTRQAAEQALGKEREGRGPYQSQSLKRERYHRYLEYHAGLNALAPMKPDGMTQLDFSQELVEFYDCVAIFKPMVAPMASRFTAATTSVPATRDEAAADVSHDTDTPREAAKLGMFGDMTRSIVDFAPCSLLCKRFNVTPPHSGASARGAYTQPSEAAAPSINNISGAGPLVERQGLPVAADQAPTPVKAHSWKADTFIRDTAESEHVSEEVFDAIFGNEA